MKEIYKNSPREEVRRSVATSHGGLTPVGNFLIWWVFRLLGRFGFRSRNPHRVARAVSYGFVSVVS